jgi:hypothetical protein
LRLSASSIGPAGIARKPDADCTAEHRSGGASPLLAPLRIAHNGSGQCGFGVFNRYVHPLSMRENPQRWNFHALICQELTQIICRQISSCSSRVIAALGIAEVTLRLVSPVAAVFCESPTPHSSEFA